MSTNGLPVAASMWASTLAVISMRNDSRSPSFHSSKIFGELFGRSAPSRWRIRSYASAISCMSAYSMPLCTIFTKWPAPSGPTCDAARGAVDVGRDRLEDRPELDVGLVRSARHDAGPVERAFLAAGDAAPTKFSCLLLQRGLAPAGVGEVRVAAVDDDVAGLEQRHQLVDDRVGRPAGLDHDDDRARLARARRRSPRSSHSG